MGKKILLVDDEFDITLLINKVKKYMDSILNHIMILNWPVKSSNLVFTI